jgi:hypothetical protein
LTGMNRLAWCLILVLTFAVGAGISQPSVADAIQYTVSVDTTAQEGQLATLAFVLTSAGGDPTPDATATIVIGSVTETLTEVDGFALDEFLLPVTLGTSVNFTVDLTGSVDPIRDLFQFSILNEDPNTGFLIEGDLPGGELLNINVTGAISISTGLEASVLPVQQVAQPASLALLVTAMMGAIALAGRRRR